MKSVGLFISLLLVAAGNLFGSQPFFTSPPTVQPDTGFVNQPMMFSVSAATPDNAPLTYTWNFGDGSTGDGASLTHSYTAAGIFNASVTISTAQGNSIDESIEFAVVNSGTLAQVQIDKASAKVSAAATGKDSFSFSGTVQNVPAGITPANQTLTVNVMGISSEFTVNSKGQGKGAFGTIKFKLPKNASGGNIPVSLSLKKSTFLPAMTAAGFDPNSPDVQGVDFLTLITFGPSGNRSDIARDINAENVVSIVVDIFFEIQALKNKLFPTFTIHWTPK